MSTVFGGDNNENTLELIQIDEEIIKQAPDYQMVAQALEILDKQRLRAKNDLQTLYRLKKAALSSPMEFVEWLRESTNLSDIFEYSKSSNLSTSVLPQSSADSGFPPSSPDPPSSKSRAVCEALENGPICHDLTISESLRANSVTSNNEVFRSEVVGLSKFPELCGDNLTVNELDRVDESCIPQANLKLNVNIVNKFDKKKDDLETELLEYKETEQPASKVCESEINKMIVENFHNKSDQSNFCKNSGKIFDQFGKMPTLQTVFLIPEVSLDYYHRKRSRRAVTKYEQNLDYLLEKLVEVQKKSLHRPRLVDEVTSARLPLSRPSTPLLSATSEDDYSQIIDKKKEIRSKFCQIVADQPPIPGRKHSVLPPQRSASAPAIAIYRMDKAPLVRTNSDLKKETVFAPQPTRTIPIRFSVPNLLECTQAASPAGSESKVTNNSSAVNKAKSDPVDLNAKSEKSSHYNLPWSVEEKRRLEQLMQIYPPEEFSSRRNKKIAAALGTRTASQVGSRISKMNSQKRRNQSQQSLPSVLDEKDGKNLDAILSLEAKSSKEYKELMKLQRQFEMMSDESIKEDVHHGFKCDGCGLDPIVGVRWHCTKCKGTDAVDLCAVCKTSGTFYHPPSHRFTQIKL